ncbi:hypothetical protein TNCV_3405221 [Trichonephila clavipes]|nr:hypothetical protein TNCV_3405221 [Trichonephila clavipes]
MDFPGAGNRQRLCHMIMRHVKIPLSSRLPDQVSSTSLDHGSKLRGPSPKALVQLNSATSCVTCCAVLLEPQLLDIMIVQFRNEKVRNHGSIPITIDCNVVAFLVFEEGFHQPIKRTKQSVFLDVKCFDIHLWISFTPNAAVLFVDVAIQPEVRFIAKQN